MLCHFAAALFDGFVLLQYQESQSAAFISASLTLALAYQLGCEGQAQLCCILQSCINYADMLSQPLEHSSLRAAAAVYHIHIMERDIIMNQALEDAASQQPGPVIGIFGADHVQGIASQWETSAAQLSEKAFSMVDISPQSIFKESQTCQGVRHALFERFFELSASHGTCAAMQHYLPHLPDGAREAYELTKEIYGSTRMMLACLSQQDLVEVCLIFLCSWLEQVLVLMPAKSAAEITAWDYI